MSWPRIYTREIKTREGNDPFGLAKLSLVPVRFTQEAGQQEISETM